MNLDAHWSKLAAAGEKLFAADDAQARVIANPVLPTDKAAEAGRRIVALAEREAAASLPDVDLWSREAAILRAQAVALDRMAEDHPDEGAILSEAAGELRNAASSLRAAIAAIRERAADAA